MQKLKQVDSHSHVNCRTQASDKALGKETGADEYMTKSFEPEELMATIDKMLGNNK